jgi:hypothetical protein
MPTIMLTPMRWAAICAVALLSGCSLGGDEEPAPATGASRAIATVVDQLERAARAGDAAAVCRDLLTPAARQRAGGARCARRLRKPMRALQDPSIQLRGLRLDRGTAVASVRTRNAGRGRADTSLELRLVRGEWRIEALRK